MPIDFSRLIAMLLATLMVANCASLSDRDKDNWGEANRQTMAAQIIDPAPRYEYANPETSAEHAAQAVERYRRDNVKRPDTIKTSQAGAASGIGASGQSSSSGH